MTAPPVRPADRRPCPGCGEPIHFAQIACNPCYRRVPGALKSDFMHTDPGTTPRARVVNRMRAWLQAHAGEAS